MPITTPASARPLPPHTAAAAPGNVTPAAVTAGTGAATGAAAAAAAATGASIFIVFY